MARKPTTTAGGRKRAPAVRTVAPGVAVPEASAPLPPPRRKPIWTHLYFQVLVAISLGALIGHLWPTFGESLKPLGDAFIRLVKMIIDLSHQVFISASAILAFLSALQILLIGMLSDVVVNRLGRLGRRVLGVSSGDVLPEDSEET